MTARADGSGALEAVAVTIDRAVDTEAAYLSELAGVEPSFWLDSSRVAPGLSRFSFLGGGNGPLAETLRYRVASGEVEISAGDRSEIVPGNPFDVLDARLRARPLAHDGLPFPFVGGYVGYFGYECKAACGASAAHTSDLPDAIWLFADRLIAVDHELERTYVVALTDARKWIRRAGREWARRTAERLSALPDDRGPARPAPPEAEAAPVDLESHLVRDRSRYCADIEQCQRELADGESYEICLTNRLHLPFEGDDLDFYLRLRRSNPAPYAALLRFADCTIFSSSPERFLRIDAQGTVESKPIKGTAPRSADPAQDARLADELAHSAKTRAENLMIVDLLRNDLGRVCEIGSVSVPRYMAVESYATVHQLVSTVTGQLRPEVSAISCAQRCFPGGSVTGAPKLRTMEIIDRLETEARGVYSGALGYFGVDGRADLSIVIRTAVRVGTDLSVGAGGAIVLDSDPAEEFEEMLLKAAAPLQALAGTPGGHPAAQEATA